MNWTELVERYNVRQNRPQGILTTDMTFPCLVVISFAYKEQYRDRDVHGDLSIVDYIGSGRIEKGDQKLHVGGNSKLASWDGPIILITCPSKGVYKSQGYYTRVDDYKIEQHDGRRVFVFRLMKRDY